MFQSQQQQQPYQHGNTAGTSASEWDSDYTQLRMTHNEYNTELTKFSNKYGSGGNENHEVQRGAASELPSQRRERWTEEECKKFVIGLGIYGRGKWKLISEKVLQSKTPSQIASHAQKYFMRQGSQNKKRRSIHDITTDHVQNQDSVPPLPPHNCNDVAPPQDQLQQQAVHAEKAMVILPHVHLAPFPQEPRWEELEQFQKQSPWDQLFLDEPHRLP